MRKAYSVREQPARYKSDNEKFRGRTSTRMADSGRLPEDRIDMHARTEGRIARTVSDSRISVAEV